MPFQHLFLKPVLECQGIVDNIKMHEVMSTHTGQIDTHIYTFTHPPIFLLPGPFPISVP